MSDAITDDSVRAKLEQLEGQLETLTKERSVLDRRLVTTRHQITAWKRVAAALDAVNGNAKPHAPKSSSPRSAPRPVRQLILDQLADGRVRSVADLHDAIGGPKINSALTELVARGRVERVGIGRYRVAAGEKPRLVGPVANAAPGAPEGSFEPLDGRAAPKATCPLHQTVWSPSVGMSNGRYVYKCTKCGKVFFHDARRDDRP